MATISSTLKMLDGMSGPIGKVISQMNKLIQNSERLNRVMVSAPGASLVPVKTVSDQQRIIKHSQQIIHLTQVINNNYHQVNNTLNQTNNIINENSRDQQRFNEQLRSGRSESNRLLSTMRNIAATYLSFQGAKLVVGTSDEYVNTLARLNLINDGLQTTAQLQEKIFAAADRARGSYTDMAGVIGRMGILAADAFTSNDELIAFSELMQKSFRVGGASTMEQQAGMYQLSQAMAAGKLQGDEFRSIMESAPMLADAIAKFTGKSKGELKEMSAEGLITADIIKGAMFAAADDINAKFEAMPRTFGDIANQIKNRALQAFGPAIERISGMLNDPKWTSGVDGISRAFSAAAVAAVWLLGAIGNISDFISTNWTAIEPILWGVVAAFGAWLVIARMQAIAKGLLAVKTAVLTGATVAQTLATKGLTAAWKGLNAAQKANVFVFIISAIVALVMWLINLWKTNDEFAAALMRAWNWILNFFDKIPAYFWQLVEWLLTPFQWWASTIGQIYDVVINGIIKGINSVLKLVNKITGKSYEIAAEFSFENIADAALEYAGAKKDEAYERAAVKAAEREQKVLDFLEERAANRALKEAENQAKQSNELWQNDWTIPNINKVNEVGKIRDTVDISSEDLKMMRELAEMKSIQNFVTLTPTVNVRTGDIRNGYDIDTIVARIRTTLEEEIASSAQGVYG